MNIKIALPILAVVLSSAYPVHSKQINTDDVPVSVINGLKSRHPDAKNISIDKMLHFRMDLYEVKFIAGNDQNVALFDSQGRPFGHEETIDPGQLPAAINKKLETAFINFKIRNSELIRHPDGRVEYEVKVKGDGTDWEMAMSPNGNILTKNLADI